MTSQQMVDVMRIGQHHLDHHHLHLGLLTLGELLQSDTGFTDERLIELKLALDLNLSIKEITQHD